MNEQQQRALAEGLKALAATTRDASASSRVEAEVMAAFAREVRPPAPLTPAHSRLVWGAIAASLIFASASGAWLSSRHARTAQAAVQQAGFLQIPGTAYLPPMESGAIVRVELPVTALPSYGIQIVPDMYTDSVDVDLLVAQDGLARGIRLVNDSQRFRSTP
jgi:hypothetical protein